jgi:hypothetical protein
MAFFAASASGVVILLHMVGWVTGDFDDRDLPGALWDRAGLGLHPGELLSHVAYGLALGATERRVVKW